MVSKTCASRWRYIYAAHLEQACTISSGALSLYAHLPVISIPASGSSGFSLVGDASGPANRRDLVLVHGSMHRPASPSRKKRNAGQTRHDPCLLPQALPHLHFLHSRSDGVCSGKNRSAQSSCCGPGLSGHGQNAPACGYKRSGSRRSAGRTDELFGRRLQLLLNALHHGHL